MNTSERKWSPMRHSGIVCLIYPKMRQESLGRTCNAAIRTDANEIKIITLINERHPGDHPVTMRALSAAAAATPSRSVTGRASVTASSAFSPPQSAVDSPCASPLLSQTIFQTIIYSVECQTDDIHLKRLEKKTSASTGTPSRGNSKTRLTPSLSTASRVGTYHRSSIS
ncbi:hypothetical protein J6590_058819 [Homalodisca vitripennis]|nr:hypothetical protein J6590_058819 [Homalodisca vitripennis]